MQIAPVMRPDLPHAPDAAARDVIDLGAMAALVWRGKWTIAAATGAGVVAAVVYVYLLATPLFTATTSLVLETRQEQVVDFASVIGKLEADTSVINTEVEILRGRQLMGRVVDSLGLDADPEFNTWLQTPGLLATWTEAAQDRAKALLGADTTPLPDPAPAVLRERVISTLTEQVTVTNIPLSLVFNVTVQTRDPAKSARIADELARLYVLDQINLKYAATEQATTWLAGRVTALRADLEMAEAAVKDFRATTDVADAESLDLANQQLTTLRARLAEQRALSVELTARLGALQGAGDDVARADVAADLVLARLIPQGGALRQATDTVAFERRFAEIVARTSADLGRTNQQIATLERARADLEATISRQSDELITFQQLTREADAIRLIYEYFLNRLQETSVQQGLQQADSRLLSAAVVPERAAAPKKTRSLAIAAVLGMLAGVALVFLADLRIAGFRSARGLETALGLPVLATIPALRTGDARGFLAALSRQPAAAAAIRNLRMALVLADPDRQPGVIVVASANPAEGKSALALSLAQGLAGLGRKVLLIDGDLHRGGAGSGGGAGLAGLIRGQTTPDQAVQHDLGGFDLLPSGARGNAADGDLLLQDGWGMALAALRARYDCILIDSPALLLHPDAQVLARAADSVLVAVRWQATSEADLRSALRLLASAGARIAGLVLTRVDARALGNRPREVSAYGRARGLA